MCGIIWTTTLHAELQSQMSASSTFSYCICRHLGIPLAEEKLEGPTTCLVFLGILIDTVRGELRLPQYKLDRLREQIGEWLQKKRCTQKRLLSIAGQLQHAATVVWPGSFCPAAFRSQCHGQKEQPSCEP